MGLIFGRAPLTFQSFQGALSGGGYLSRIAISPDGLTRTICYDSGNGWLWNATTSQWDNAFSTDRLAGTTYGVWHNGLGTANAIVPAPSKSERVIAVCEGSPGPILKSEDRCASWTDTGFTTTTTQPASTVGRGVNNPFVAIDPANPDVCYIINKNGTVQVTYDNFATFTTHATAPANTSASYMGCVVFDPTSGTTTVNGVTVTKGIYIGWYNGQTAVYESLDGGQTFTATTGGPAGVKQLSMSADGVLYAADAADITHGAWRYVTPSSTSGLTVSTWTNFTSSNMATSSGNRFHSCAADPLNAGHVAFLIDSGGIQFSGDYGANWYPTGTVALGAGRDAGDVAWLGPWTSPNTGTAENWMSNGSCVFDPVVSGKLYIVEGIGVWSCSPPVSTGSQPTITATGQNKNQQGIIVDQIVKPPSAPLIMSSQDRAAFYITDLATEPTGDAGIVEIGGGNNAGVLNAWGIDYAKDGSDFRLILTTTGIYKSTNKGSSWSLATNSFGGQGPLAVQSDTNYVIFQSGKPPAYTADGSTYDTCLFQSAPIGQGWDGFYTNRHIVCADPNTTGVYYSFNYGARGAFTASLNAAGAGYTVGQVVWFGTGQTNSGGSFSPSAYLIVDTVDGGGAITAAHIVEAGNTYSSPSDGTYVAGVVASALTLNDGGSGYQVGDTLSSSGGSGQFSAAKATVSSIGAGGTITGITPINNYNASTGVGLPGSGAIAVDTFSGYGYFKSDALPTNPVSCTGGHGTGATFDLTFPTSVGATFDLTFDYIGGLWKTTDGGANWSRIFDGWIVTPSPYFSTLNAAAQDFQMQGVVGEAGHFLLSNGLGFNPAHTPGYIWDGTGLHPISGIDSCWMLTAGKKQNDNQTYPTLFFAGTVMGNSTPGVFMSTDFDPSDRSATWTRLCDSPAKNANGPKTMCGDWDEYGACYIGTQATGYVGVKLAA